MQELLESLGYLGAYLGAIMEGELLFLTAIQLSTMGYLNYYGVLVAVFAGTLTADWLFYLSGRARGHRWISRYPKLEARFRRMDQRMVRYDGWLLFFYRFMYGFRIVLPALFGIRGIPPWRFGLFSLLATSGWTALFVSLGYYFSDWMLRSVKGFQEYGWIGLLFVLLLIIYFSWGSVSGKNHPDEDSQ
jgi:membrane protein DedA with SNARE-associated domain